MKIPTKKTTKLLLDNKKNLLEEKKKLKINQKHKTNEKNETMEENDFLNLKTKIRIFFFLCFLFIVEEFHHLHKAMGGGSTSPWHMYHNEPVAPPIM